MVAYLRLPAKWFLWQGLFSYPTSSNHQKTSLKIKLNKTLLASYFHDNLIKMYLLYLEDFFAFRFMKNFSSSEPGKQRN